jgi:hypothetical protein
LGGVLLVKPLVPEQEIPGGQLHGLYKHLPLKIKKLDNFNRFRKEVKSTLLKNLFYMIEEFLQANLV